MIGEDSPGVRYRLEEFLKAPDSVELLTPRTAVEALEMLPMEGPADEESGLDLTLMDTRMPQMAGIEACAAIKSDEFVGGIPVIMVTAHDDEEHLSAAFNAGAMDSRKRPTRIWRKRFSSCRTPWPM